MSSKKPSFLIQKEVPRELIKQLGSDFNLVYFGDDSEPIKLDKDSPLSGIILNKTEDINDYKNTIDELKKNLPVLPVYVITNDYKAGHINRFEKKLEFNNQDGYFSLKNSKTDSGPVSISKFDSIANKNFHLLFDNANDMILIAELLPDGTPGKILEANKYACRKLGYSKEEILNLSISDLDDIVKDRELISESLDKALNRGEVILKRRIKTRQGKILNLEVRSQVSNWQEKPVVFSIARDITNSMEIEKRLEEALALTRRHLAFNRALLSSIPTPIFFKDTRGRYIGCNQAFTKMAGKTIEEIYGKTVGEVWPQHYSEVYEQKDNLLLETQKPQKYEFEIIDKDGRNRNVYFVKDIFRDEAGEVAGIIGAYIDITDRIDMEKALKESEIKLKSFIENAPYGIFIADTQGRYMDVNRKACDITGYSREELLKMSLIDITFDEERDKVIESFQLLKNDSVIQVEHKFIRRNSKTGIWTVNAVKINDNCFMGFVQDVTKIREIENELKNQKERLEEANKKLTHDINIINEAQAEISKFKRIMDIGNFGICLLTLDRKIIYSNEYYAKLHGCDSKDLTGKEFCFEHMESAEYLDELFRLVMTQGGFTSREVLHKNYKGSLIPMLMSAKLFHDDSGKPALIAASAIDVSNLKAIEAELRNSEEKLNSILTSMDDLVFSLNNKGIITSFYQPVEKPLITSRPVGNHYEVVLPRTISEPLKKAIIELEVGEEVIQFDYPYSVKDETHWGSAKISALRDNNNKHKGIIFVSRDITGRKQLEESIKKENFKFHSILSNMDEGVLYVNKADIIEETNSYFCQLMQETSCKFQKRPIYEFLSYVKNNNKKNDVIQLLEFVVSSLEKIKKNPNAHSFKIQKSINDKQIIINAKPIFSNSEYSGLLFNFVDVTELVESRRQLETTLMFAETARREAEAAREISERNATELAHAYKKLSIAKREAEVANKLKSEFLANMSHEIRTPLNAIVGFSDLLKKKDISDREKSYVNYIFNSSRHLLSLINDILDLSKIEAGRLEVVENRFDLKKSLKEIISLMKPEAENKGVKLKFYYDEYIPEELTGDQQHIKQIILNLVSNAVKFTDKGKIEITASELEPPDENNQFCLIQIIVADTGTGICEKKLNNIFEPFVRGVKSTSREKTGTGLGLAIVKRFVEFLKGEIEVNSTWGKGTTVAVRLPLKRVPQNSYLLETFKPSEIQSAKNKDASKDIEFPGKKILLVEDNEINQELVKTFLENTEAELEVAFDGLEALEKAKQFKFDLILMDIQLPKMDGYEATRQIRKLPGYKNIPIVAVTAHAIKGDEIKAKNAGCDDYLPKPLTRKEFMEHLRSLLD
ncbi:MAG: PAS domain S-box protein [Vulcanimicrobiota bacterium]